LASGVWYLLLETAPIGYWGRFALCGVPTGLKPASFFVEPTRRWSAALPRWGLGLRYAWRHTL